MAKCDSWPAKGTAPPRALHAKGAPPIVVIGTTRDPATPYAWAKSLASQLESGRLISRDGDGHTGFQQGNQCVDDAVERLPDRGHRPAGRPLLLSRSPVWKGHPPRPYTRPACPAARPGVAPP